MADIVYVVNGGLTAITAAMVTQNTQKFVAWGTGGATAAAKTQTAMTTAAAPTTATAVTGTPTAVTTTQSNDTYQVVATVSAGGTLAINEVGILNQATVSGATMFLRGTFDVINVNSGDSIEFTIKTQFTN